MYTHYHLKAIPGVSSALEKLNHSREEGIKRNMVKLTDEQRAMLEALDKMPDEEIDFSDIPERPIDWSKARIAPFYRPILKDFSLRLEHSALDCLKSGLRDGQSLDEAVNKALHAEMFRIRFPVRVQNAEKRIRRIQESPGEIEDLYEAHKQEIEILCAMPLAEVASANIPLRPLSQANPQSGLGIKEISLNLDENIIDWYEFRLEEGQSLDEALNQALLDHITWVSSPKEATQEILAEKTVDSA